jgi:hypothetical protein
VVVEPESGWIDELARRKGGESRKKQYKEKVTDGRMKVFSDSKEEGLQ